ncbi:MAG TPA: hypothetical protein VK458_24710, partial [Myxococcaceae bacterium]|nr:hypothetical protein [Myxococcaceae bacterium]
SSDSIYIGGELVGSLALGPTPLTSNGSGDAFVAKLDAYGNHVCVAGPEKPREFGQPGLERRAGLR